MTKGRLSATYELAIPNFEVRDPGPFQQHISGLTPWTAVLAPSATGFTLEVQIDTDDPQTTLSVADAHARAVAEHLTFWLCTRGVANVVQARRVGTEYKSPDPNVLHAFPGEVVWTGHAITATVTRRVSGQDIQDVLNSFSLGQQAPPPVFANDLVVARQMFLAGLAVESRVACFLIGYAAMAVFAAFKGGSGKLQARIDALLKAEEPTIRMVNTTLKSGNIVVETEYTEARNNFIHAEDRGRDPAGAMTVLESLTDRFNVLVGRILNKG